MNKFFRLISLLLVTSTLTSCGSGLGDPLGLCDTPKTNSSQDEFNFTGTVGKVIAPQTSDITLVCSNESVYLTSGTDNPNLATSAVVIDSKVLFRLTVTPVAQSRAGVYLTTARVKLYADQAATRLLREVVYPVKLTIQ